MSPARRADLMSKTMARSPQAAARNASRLLDSLHVAKTTIRLEASEIIFAQGDHCAAVMYIERGLVRLSVASRGGKVAVLTTLHAGAFFGEGALAGQRRRRSTAETVTASTIAIVKTAEMRRRLHEEAAFSECFRAHMLRRNIRIEEDRVDQWFDRSEKRLARALLLLAHFDEHQSPRCALPPISRNLLAEMSQTTGARVNVLMHRFRKLGFVERSSERHGGLEIDRSILRIVLQD